MQEYISYIVNQIKLFDETSIDSEDDIYKKWLAKRGITTKEFLTHAIGKGWINDTIFDSKRGYFTTDEIYDLIITEIMQNIANDSEFKKRLFKWLLYEERIKGSHICQLLYDQQVLSTEDNDYKKFISGAVDAFSFIKRKAILKIMRLRTWIKS